MKELSEMTLEELWELFPISLTEHRPEWAATYAEMEVFLREIFADCNISRISHIGSTAVKDICSKDIVDILVEVERDDLKKAARAAEDSGFICMSESDSRISLNKGYTPAGYADRVYHLHIRCNGDNDELYFRDYLNEHPETAARYGQLKLELCRSYSHDRDAYTAAKTSFVKKWTAEARRIYKGRY